MDYAMKGLIGNLLLDIETYLSYIEEFGRPNCKYFNFVLNKLGLMHIFLYKNRFFYNKSYIAIKFIDFTLTAIKRKFLEEKTNLRKSALIFLISKIYFTDDIATNLKLRIIKDEWTEFVQFFNNVKQDGEYQDVCIMFCHLYTENFFRFTMKSVPLALEYGDNQPADCFDITYSTLFWNEINDDMKNLEMTEMQELRQLAATRSETIKHFSKVLPETAQVEDIFENFQEVTETLNKFNGGRNKTKSRKEVLQICRDYLKSTGSASTKNIEDEMDDLDSIIKSVNNDKPEGSSKPSAKKIKLENSDSDAEMDVLDKIY